MRTSKQCKMKRLRKRKAALPRTVQKERISRQAEPGDRAELVERAQAREQMAPDPTRHPNFVFRIVDPPKRNAAGIAIGQATEHDARTATMHGGEPTRHYERRPDENLQQFKTRVLLDLPVGGEPRYVTFGLDDKAPAPATAPDPTPTSA